MGNSGVVSEKSGCRVRISGFFPFLAHLECTLDENDGVSVGHSFGREDTMQEVIIEVILSLQFLRKMSFSSIFFFFKDYTEPRTLPTSLTIGGAVVDR